MPFVSCRCEQVSSMTCGLIPYFKACGGLNFKSVLGRDLWPVPLDRGRRAFPILAST